jgi:hypothetical protein
MMRAAATRAVDRWPERNAPRNAQRATRNAKTRTTWRRDAMRCDAWRRRRHRRRRIALPFLGASLLCVDRDVAPLQKSPPGEH